ncbi:hypothetical protein D047_4348A, partial [Vibrio parahaemolyticus VPTS-2010_2]
MINSWAIFSFNEFLPRYLL